MKSHLSSVVACCVFAAAVAAGAPDTDPKPGVDWPSFRGIRGAGVSDGFPAPSSWDVPAKKNVRWSVTVPGLGHSSPIVWGSRLCVTTAISGKTDAGLKPGLYGDITSVDDSTSHAWRLLCYDKNTGRSIVDKEIYAGVPRIKRHLKSTHANTTLATDGTRLVAMLGSEGLHAFDLSGNRLWSKDLGVLDSGYYLAPTAQWEFASSPIIHDGKVIVQADVQKGSFVAAFDIATGKELWRTAREEIPTFSTPAIHRVGASTHVLLNGWKHIGAYDLATGKEVWKLKGLGDIPVPVPVMGHGLIFITNGHGAGSPIYAIKESAIGDISLAPNETTNVNIAWSTRSDGAYLISPLLYGDLLYVSKNNGVFSVFDARTGEKLYTQRLGSGTTAFTASIVAGDGKIYFTSEEGDVYVVKAGRTFELLGTNPVGGIVMATPAVSEGTIYFRTADKIVAVR